MLPVSNYQYKIYNNNFCMSNFHETGSVRPVMQGAQTVEIPFLVWEPTKTVVHFTEVLK